MSYGFVAFNDNNFIIVSSDVPAYEFVNFFSPYNRTGNINKYTVLAKSVPLIFAIHTTGNSSGILSVIETTPPTSTTNGTYEVEVLASISCIIAAFTPISSNAVSGTYGLAVYNGAGNLVFSSDRKVLQIVDAATILTNTNRPLSFGIDAASYVAATVRPAITITTRTTVVGAYTQPESQYVCNYVYVQDPPYFDPFFGFFVYPPPRYEYVCGFQWVNVLYTVAANIQRTAWSIERSTLKLDSKIASVQFLLHKSGYYDQVLSYTYYGSGGNFNYLPPGYTVPPSWVSANVTIQGELNTTNTYPYAAGTNLYNNIPVNYLTTKYSLYI